MNFLKAHGRLISNILVVILVAMAIYIKVTENDTEDLVHEQDIYIFAGAILAFLLIRIFQRRNKR